MPIEHIKDQIAKGTWLTYRPEIKIMDCTIRDGGLINDHNFEDDFVKAVYKTCVAAGIDAMEFGYKADKKIFAPTQFGKWKYCEEDALRRIVDDNPTDLLIAVMADAERTDYHTDIIPKSESVIDIIRVATYIHQIPTAVDMIKDAYDKGYRVTCNLMAISTIQERELEEALEILSNCPICALYIVDSFGAYYSEQIRDVTLAFLKAVEGKGIEIGIHAHNNQMLAYANTIEALIVGANRLDATINGMGRGAGNCPLELLLGFLKNPKFQLRPVLECIRDYFVPLEKNGTMEWGYKIPYMITGQLNVHPRAAIKMRGGENPDDYVAFYDQLIEEE
ncbi:MAG: aldolase catalytic domain-containing protein [Armatimonadota bacterium]